MLRKDGERLAEKRPIGIEDLRQERLLLPTYCEHAEPLAAPLRSRGVESAHDHEVASVADLASQLGAGVGVAVAPLTESIKRHPL